MCDHQRLPDTLSQTTESPPSRGKPLVNMTPTHTTRTEPESLTWLAPPMRDSRRAQKGPPNFRDTALKVRLQEAHRDGLPVCPLPRKNLRVGTHKFHRPAHGLSRRRRRPSSRWRCNVVILTSLNDFYRTKSSPAITFTRRCS